MRRHDVDGNFARLFNNVGKFFMFLNIKINLSYFPSRARLNFQWIFKEFDLKSNVKGFFENFVALIGKETEESVDDSSLDQWSWTSVSCRILSLYGLFSDQ